MEKMNDKSLKVRKGLRTAELAVLLIGAVLDVMLVVLDMAINPFIALLLSLVIAALLFLRRLPVKYFTSELKEVNAQDFITWFGKIAIIAALACISPIFRELLQTHIWITGALAIFFILQFAELLYHQRNR